MVDEVQIGLRDGTPTSKLLKIVHDMPAELTELYKRTYDRIEEEYRNEGFAMMMVVLASPTKITLQMLMECVDDGFGYLMDPRAHDVTLEDSDRAREKVTESSMRRRLESRTGGLLELQPGKESTTEETIPNNSTSSGRPQGFDDEVQSMSKQVPFVEEASNVQFIHQTTREFAVSHFHQEDPVHLQSMALLPQGISVGHAFLLLRISSIRSGDRLDQLYQDSNVLHIAKSLDLTVGTRNQEVSPKTGVFEPKKGQWESVVRLLKSQIYQWFNRCFSLLCKLGLQDTACLARLLACGETDGSWPFEWYYSERMLEALPSAVSSNRRHEAAVNAMAIIANIE